MRRLLILVILLTITIINSAQDDIIMPENLPEPIYENRLLYYFDANQLAWMDNQTFVFTPDNRRLFEDEKIDVAYQYNLETGLLTELDLSPFIADMSEEALEWYHVAQQWGDVMQSPYYVSDNAHNILYTSTLPRFTGYGFLIVMRGLFSPETSYANPGADASYIPIDPYNLGGFRVTWSQDNSAAIIEAPDYSWATLYYYDLVSDEDIEMPFGLTDYVEDRTLAISVDGKRAAFATHFDSITMSDSSTQNLIIWDAPYYDALCKCTYDAKINMVEPLSATTDLDYPFAGVGFVDEDTILYIGELGLMRHNLLTGISNIIDRELNTAWIRTAVFSPDNRHVAITTEQGLYVIPLSL